MAEFLSDAWLDRYAELGAELPEIPDVDASISYEVAGAPAGKVRYHEVISAGRVVEVNPGKLAGAEIAVTWKYPEAVAWLQGKDPEASFMEGRTKVEGDYPRWLLGLRPLRTSDAWKAMLAALAAESET